MSKRFMLFLVCCLLLLPSCVTGKNGFFAKDPNAPVEFNFDDGERVVHVESMLTMFQEDKQIGDPMMLVSNDLRYVVEERGGRFLWKITGLNRVELGVADGAGSYLDFSFTSNAKGNDKADLVINEARNDEDHEYITIFMASAVLPEGSFKPGEVSIPIPDGALKSDDMEIRLNSPDPRYVYTGITKVAGQECYAFSFHEESMTFVKDGKEIKGSMDMSMVTSKNMLPVSEEVLMILDGPGEGMKITIATTSTMVDEPYDSKVAYLRARLKTAPIKPVTEPMDFKYSPGQGRYYASSKSARGNSPDDVKLFPSSSYSYNVKTEAIEGGLGWNIVMDDMVLWGRNLDTEPFMATYTTDKFGENIENITVSEGAELFTKEDFQEGLIIPKGSYRTGDVVMPVSMRLYSLVYDLNIPEGAGYVFKGIQTIDDMKVVVLEASLPSFPAIHKTTGKKSMCTVKAVRRYDMKTMLPLWYQWQHRFIAEDNSVKGKDSDFIRMSN